MIVTDAGRAGTARRIGTATVLEAMSSPIDQTWIANTDADTVVPPRWLTTGEDHDLWNRLRRYGPTLSTTALTVATSARRTGRAPEGFAADLSALCNAAVA